MKHFHHNYNGVLKDRRTRMIFETVLCEHHRTILQQLRRMPDYHQLSDQRQALTRELHGRKN